MSAIVLRPLRQAVPRKLLQSSPPPILQAISFQQAAGWMKGNIMRRLPQPLQIRWKGTANVQSQLEQPNKTMKFGYADISI
jgi:hypothetical protein